MTVSVLNHSSKHWTSKQQLNNKKYVISLLISFFIVSNRLTVVQLLFCSLTKGITPKMCRLCVCVIINKRSFEPFTCLGLEVAFAILTQFRGLDVTCPTLLTWCLSSKCTVFSVCVHSLAKGGVHSPCSVQIYSVHCLCFANCSFVCITAHGQSSER